VNKYAFRVESREQLTEPGLPRICLAQTGSELWLSLADEPPLYRRSISGLTAETIPHTISIHRMVAVVGSAVAVWTLLFLIFPSTFSFDYDQNIYLGGAAALRAGHGYRFEQYIDLPRIGVYLPGYSTWRPAFWKYG
jgi:hypothetical protein